VPYVSVDEALNATVVDPGETAGMSRPGAQRLPLVASEDLRIVLLRMNAGEEPHRPHCHPRADEVMIIVEGRGLFTVGDEPDFVAGPRSLVFVPRGVVHRIRIPGPEPMVWLSVVSPNEDAPDESVEVEA
jgi:mannose-6-phosphate isomerase-like protein (cupin superfamily)